MFDDSRRRFIFSSSKLLVCTATLTSISANAGTHKHHVYGDESDGITIASSLTHSCGTCEFWGGMRIVSKDKKTITAQSMGWCNNPDSINYQKLTSVDHVMKQTGVWKKWPVLGHY